MKKDRNPMNDSVEVITITRSKSKFAWYKNLVGKDIEAYSIDRDGDAKISREEIRKHFPKWAHGGGYVTSGEFRIKNF